MSTNRKRSDRPFDDNGIGVISYRGWLYSGDTDGKRFDPASGEAIPCRPTPWHARSNPVNDSDRPDPAEEIARLSKDERRAWELQQGRYDPEMHRMTICASELVHAFREGYTLIPGTSREEGGIMVVDVEGQQFTKQGLSYLEIAERISREDRILVTWRQVKRWLVEARRKLRGM